MAYYFQTTVGQGDIPLWARMFARRLIFLLVGLGSVFMCTPYPCQAADMPASQTLDSDSRISNKTIPIDLTVPLSLSDCVRLALENSMELGATQNGLQLAKLVKEDADNIYWPRVKGGVDYIVDDGSLNETLGYNRLQPFLTIAQNELNSAENYKKLRDSATQLLEAKIDLLRAKRKLIALVADSYFAVYLYQKQLLLDQEEIAYQKRRLKDLQLKYKDGMISEIETLEAETQLATKELQLQKGNNALTQSIMALAVVMGLPAESRLQIAEIDSGKPFHITWERCRDTGLEYNIELKTYEEAAEEMKRLHKAASWTRWPSFSAKAYLGENPPQGFSPDANIGVSLTLSQNLYDGGETRRRISRAAIEVEQYRILVQHYRQTFINDLHLLYNQFVNRKEELSLATQKHQLAAKLFDLTQSSYEMGTISLEEKHKTEQTVRQSEIMFSRATVNYMAAEIKLKIEMRIDPWQNQANVLDQDN